MRVMLIVGEGREVELEIVDVFVTEKQNGGITITGHNSRAELACQVDLTESDLWGVAQKGAAF